MQRYTLYDSYEASFMEEYDDGDYVLNSEAQAEIARLTAEVERLRGLEVDTYNTWKLALAKSTDHIWNDAIEAAAKDVQGWGELYASPYGSDIMEDIIWDINLLKRPT